jgi:glycosyltransferase involved in cell wall biosynthesis
LQIVLVGTLDPSVPPPPNISVLGPYRHDAITTLASRHRVGAWLIPSIWPETFCFTLHEALATGLPTVGFDLGAVGEALHAAAENGAAAHAIPLGEGPDSAVHNVGRALARIKGIKGVSCVEG